MIAKKDNDIVGVSHFEAFGWASQFIFGEGIVMSEHYLYLCKYHLANEDCTKIVSVRSGEVHYVRR